ncbi:unnamed protein product [Linum tenue]|uniref:Fatty acid desaturase domain-containing protein n=1 Tax=Linum tenue TaxID=586396 RepID=A0AAV0IHD5_9ROSI|nr:unnamed protein product [Linum tenue]
MAVGEANGVGEQLNKKSNGAAADPNLSPPDVSVVSHEQTRKWNLWDKTAVVSIVAAHLLALYAPFCFSWGAFWVAFCLYTITGLFGINLSYHRHLSHKSFRIPKWLEYLFAYCGAHALQGDPLYWVSTHRFHHQYTDTERDPHSPIQGFWYSHISWIFDSAASMQCGEPNNVGDLENQTFYRWLYNTYMFHPLGLGFLLYWLGGFPYIVWGMGVRLIGVYHATWLINSAAHTWGARPWNTGDLSRNNWWVALLGFGEGWHNNHHAFKYSARHGLEWWQIDMTWYAVRLLEAVGLAVDVKRPSQLQMQKLATKKT